MNTKGIPSTFQKNSLQYSTVKTVNSFEFELWRVTSMYISIKQIELKLYMVMHKF